MHLLHAFILWEGAEQYNEMSLRRDEEKYAWQIASPNEEDRIKYLESSCQHWVEAELIRGGYMYI